MSGETARLRDRDGGIARPGPDVVSASEAYARRFSGSAGAWMLDVQTRAVDGILSGWDGDVLDVGGGHGQITPHLLDRGRDVVTLVSNEEAAGRLRHIDRPGLQVIHGSVDELALPDRSADIVIALRMMAHVSDWRAFLASLARVARSGVIVDFPNAGGANALSGLLFGVKRRIEGDTRPYVRIRLDDVRGVLAEHGFTAAAHVGEFVVPMAGHRLMRNVRVSRSLESFLRPLAPRLGNPVILGAHRSAS